MTIWRGEGRIALGVFGIIGALHLVGCANDSEVPQPAAQQALPVATAINAIMVGQIDHAAHPLWDVGREDGAPAADKDWMELEHYAVQIVSAGSAITSGGQVPWMRTG